MAATARVIIPYAPRRQFVDFHNRTERWACIVAHRRAGKTVACINDLIKAALTCEKPNPRFAYVAPYYAQAKDIAWSYLKEYGLVYPGAVPNESELRVDFPNGGRVRLYGADNYDRMRGIYLDGVVPDEPADMDPRVFPEVLRPALSDRQGWAAFIGTPKGHNYFHEIWQNAKESPDWFALQLKASQTGILPASELEDAKRSLTRDQFDQEYECSFDAAIVGAYYGRDMREAEEDGRIASVPYDKAAKVYAGWDLGRGDATAIWVCQPVGRELHLIDYIENSGVGIDWYIGELKGKPYRIDEHYLPHDAEAKHLVSEKTTRGIIESHGHSTTIIPQHRVDDGINAVRMVLNRCWFDAKKCKRGIEGLKQYRAEYDDKARTLRANPVHDWASHGADALRYLVLGLDERPNVKGWDARPLKGIV